MSGELVAFGNLLVLVLLSILLLIFLFNSYCIKIYRFYSPSCGACTASEPEWKKFKRKTFFSSIKTIEVNVNSKNAYPLELVNNFKITTVPSIWKVYTDGSRYEYSGDRSAEDLCDFAFTDSLDNR
jgi:hypothetical protein